VSESKQDPFAELFGEFGDRLRGDSWQPDVDVFETETSIVVRAELAGVRGRDLSVKVDGQVLRIGGVRLAPEDSDVQRLHRMEIASGPFERRVSIPVPFERDRVSAQLTDGFLTVSLPKRKTREQRVEVNT
jgi:HSP20 family protein